jgi:hypothetical protein
MSTEPPLIFNNVRDNPFGRNAKGFDQLVCQFRLYANAAYSVEFPQLEINSAPFRLVGCVVGKKLRAALLA